MPDFRPHTHSRFLPRAMAAVLALLAACGGDDNATDETSDTEKTGDVCARQCAVGEVCDDGKCRSLCDPACKPPAECNVLGVCATPGVGDDDESDDGHAATDDDAAADDDMADDDVDDDDVIDDDVTADDPVDDDAASDDDMSDDDEAVGCESDAACDVGWQICDPVTRSCVPAPPANSDDDDAIGDDDETATIECESDAGCPAPFVCLVSDTSGRCVECLDDAQCDAGWEICDAAEHKCAPNPVPGDDDTGDDDLTSDDDTTDDDDQSALIDVACAGTCDPPCGTDAVCGDSACREASALRFDGANWVQIYAYSHLNLSTGRGYTVEFWMRTAQDGFDDFVSLLDKGSAIAGNPYPYDFRMLPGGRVRFDIRDNSASDYSVTSGIALNDDAWHHVAGVWDNQARRARLFIDGKLDGEGELVPQSQGTNNGAFVTLGARLPASRYYIGLLDEIRFSSTVRFAAPFTPERRYCPDAKTAALFHADTSAAPLLLGAEDAASQGTFEAAKLHAP